jgi:hypothetical protein
VIVLPERGKTAVITISQKPEVKENNGVSKRHLNSIIEWVQLNEPILIKYWKSQGKMPLKELLAKINRV